MTYPFGQKIVWQPNPEWIKNSNLNRFMNVHGIPSYQELITRANKDITWFWDAVLTDLDIRFDQPYSRILDIDRGIKLPRWCIDGRMNIIHNCLDKWQDTKLADKNALIWESEAGETESWTYKHLNIEVNRCTNALKSLGVKKGDVVGLYMPMIPELAIAFLAVIKLGGIILPLFSGYGAGAIKTRMQDARASFILTELLRRVRLLPCMTLSPPPPELVAVLS